ncbi:hypothetical protein BH09GEM1_BH09GEM1_27850 [soil metagenome]
MWEPGKPSQNENEYFARQDAEWLKAQRAKLNANRAAKESKPSGMRCPRCDGELREREFHDVLIDVCASCRGIWLDAGEMHMLAHVNPPELLAVIKEIDTAAS